MEENLCEVFLTADYDMIMTMYPTVSETRKQPDVRFFRLFKQKSNQKSIKIQEVYKYFLITLILSG